MYGFFANYVSFYVFIITPMLWSFGGVEMHLLELEDKGGWNQRHCSTEPSVTPELSAPQHVWHTVYRGGQRPNGTASKAARRSHTNTNTHMKTNWNILHTYTQQWAAHPVREATDIQDCRTFWAALASWNLSITCYLDYKYVTVQFADRAPRCVSCGTEGPWQTWFSDWTTSSS